jgi:hypothetical protein
LSTSQCPLSFLHFSYYVFLPLLRYQHFLFSVSFPTLSTLRFLPFSFFVYYLFISPLLRMYFYKEFKLLKLFKFRCNTD